MAVTLNAKGTSVPYFRIGKSGVTLFQGINDPHVSGGHNVRTNDIWFDTNERTLKFRTSQNTWEALNEADKMSELNDVDLTGLADGYFLRYNAVSSKWEPHETSGGLASDWGSILENAINYDGYTGDVWQLNNQTQTLIYNNNVNIGNQLTVDTISTQSHVNIGGNLQVTGNATISGNLTFGDASTDTIALAADINSNLVPETNSTYNLGSSTQQWNDTFISGTIDNSANTGAMLFPTGTTVQRPTSAQEGMVRFNSDTKRFEGYNGTEWINIDIPDDWGSINETP